MVVCHCAAQMLTDAVDRSRMIRVNATRSVPHERELESINRKRAMKYSKI
jgi:hypothetical protein